MKSTMEAVGTKFDQPAINDLASQLVMNNEK